MEASRPNWPFMISEAKKKIEEAKEIIGTVAGQIVDSSDDRGRLWALSAMLDVISKQITMLKPP